MRYSECSPKKEKEWVREKDGELKRKKMKMTVREKRTKTKGQFKKKK